jgi:hypothetical protein
MVSEMKAVRERDVSDRRTAQAQRVGAWIPGGAGKRRNDAPAAWRYTATASIKNSSDEPVYDVDLRVTSIGIGPVPSLEGRARLGTFPPDFSRQVPIELGDAPYRPDILQPDLMAEHMSVELSFRDAGGRSWRRRSDGVLEES